MLNEVLLLLTVFVFFGGTLVFYHLFGRAGIYCWTVIAAITANIEVLILVEAFGMEQTLGNVMFASSFLATDILSENEGKDAAKKAVSLGIAASIAFIVITQLWLFFKPSPNDWAMPSIRAIFSNTPRLMMASLIVYAVTQHFDVWAYHRWWEFSTGRFGDSRRFLWLRNNGSTLISQLLNTVLFNLFAFAGVYDGGTLLSIIASGYAIYVVTSLLDTPAVYLARHIKEKRT